jgi:hypothetical protein
MLMVVEEGEGESYIDQRRQGSNLPHLFLCLYLGDPCSGFLFLVSWIRVFEVKYIFCSRKIVNVIILFSSAPLDISFFSILFPLPSPSHILQEVENRHGEIRECRRCDFGW